MRRFYKGVLLFLCAVFSATMLSAQDDGFGFGFDDSPGGGGSGTAGSAASPVTISGEATGSLQGFINDFDDADSVKLGSIFSGKLNFAANTSYGGAVIKARLAPSPEYYGGKSPVYVDEAYAQGNFGSIDIEAGLRKLTWGKADSMGPLDVINPIDYSDASALTNTGEVKIARPMIHAALHVGNFSKLEAVFVPNFEPLRFAETGRWSPAQFAALSQLPAGSVVKPDTTTLDYAQAGLRFTTTIGSSDIGVQYYYGRLTTPAVTQTMSATPPLPIVTFAYNRYHHIGADYAQVIGGFNVRAEFSANITGDWAGDDGEVYNPFLAWNLGFDRSLFWNIKINLQANEKVRLMHGNIGNNPAQDTEAGTDITSTRITAVLSRAFLRDKLECKLTALWDIEDRGCYILPGLSWKQDDIALELAGGIFAGDAASELGQYHDNGFLRMQMTYSF
jgi:hypothetical protein